MRLRITGNQILFIYFIHSIHLSRASHYATTNASNKDSRPENTKDNRPQFHFTMKILILLNTHKESNLIDLIGRCM